ncbi:MAG: hypothetical protein GY776_09005 [Alteromonas sp.]|nr:hypothetical protein [Alteromonas sp.]
MSLVSIACHRESISCPFDHKWEGVLRLHGSGRLLQMIPREMQVKYITYCMGLVTGVVSPNAIFLRSLLGQLVEAPYENTQLVGFWVERIIGVEQGFGKRKELRKEMQAWLLKFCQDMDGAS